MIVEHADRFGLSQLHQIRGRVGRSDLESRCYLVTRGPVTGDAEERLRAVERESDGFRIAEEDLRLRGAGELLGERQHGPLGCGVADLLRDASLLEAARREAFARSSFGEDLPDPIRAAASSGGNVLNGLPRPPPGVSTLDPCRSPPRSISLRPGL
jgi:ATP-dependent DNA helicase RecG